MSEAVRAGVVGFGVAGQVFHAAVIHETPGLELASVVTSSDGPRRELAGAKYPGVRVAASLDEMLEDSSIQLCIVATPNHLHRSIAEACMRANRHVVVDKPLALTSEDARILAKVARECKVLLGAYHNRRWDGDFQTVRELLASGRLGRPVLFESHFDRFRPEPKAGAWRETKEAGGGVLFDLGPHLLDQALALFGAPSTLWADVRMTRGGVEVDDGFDIHMAYEDGPHAGLRVLLRSTVFAASPGARYTLHGTAGSYEKWGLDPQEQALRDGARFSDDGFGHEPRANWGVLTLPGAAPETVPTLAGDYRNFYANVRDAILGKTRLNTGVDTAWSVARLIELARESSREGRRLPVDLEPAAALSNLT